ncbi:hypothetical protein DKX38_000163 [Salix brachista]|uniref:Uncharacterized protein n=1 Tax=Salix brachista TaxID=2182728 RepID=A0A5N5P0N7_9ROSI|nr:hypothetical protein DKX38_000163 [Salix brachista]
MTPKPSPLLGCLQELGLLCLRDCQSLPLILKFRSRGSISSMLKTSLPQSAIPAIMNVFANLESLGIKLCNYPSRTSHPPYRQNITRMKAKREDEVLHVSIRLMIDWDHLHKEQKSEIDCHR